jgi:Peptidase inhibitor family I36
MSGCSVRRALSVGAAGTALALAVTLGGAIPGIASAAVPTAAPSTDLAANSVDPESAALAAAHGNPGEFDVFDDFNFQGRTTNLGNASGNLTGNWFSSAVNNTRQAMCLYASPGFQGFFVFLPQNGGFVDKFDSQANNMIASVRPSPDGTNC